MSVIFLLGPGMWSPDKVASRSPMDVRRRLARILGASGHRVVLMEDAPDVSGEDMIQKFDRLLRDRVTDVVLYWPAQAKMQTTYDELILLYERKDFIRRARISLWVLHHVSVARITRDEFRVLEAGQRSRYLEAIARLGVTPLEWHTDAECEEWARMISSELDS
jgi:hypothetical protein